MQSKVRALASGLGACAALGLFLVGVPVCLVTMVGNPLPAGVPEWSSVVTAVEAGALPEGVADSVLAVTVWIWWSQVALSFAAEVWAAWRGRSARSLPLRALGAQPIVVRLVAIIVAAAATVGAVASPAVAATPSFAEVTVPMNVGGSSGGQTGGTTTAVPHAAAAGTVAAMAGSPPAPVLGLPDAAAVEVAPVAPAPVLGLPDAAAVEVAPVAPAPVLGAPVPAIGDGSQPQQPPSQSAPGGERSTSLRQDPVLGAPVPAIGDGSQPQQPPSQSAPGGERSTSLRQDPVLAPEAAAPADRVPGPPAVSASGAGPVPAPVASLSAAPSASSVAAAVAATFAHPGGSEWVVVRPGDSLWLLAERHLGDAQRWPDIFELNVGQLEGGGTLRDPNLIYPGWRLRLPPADSPEEPEVPDQPGPATPAAAVAARAPVVPAEPASR